MKKCKYHCDYGDGENCHHDGDCVLFETAYIGASEISEICTECMVCGETIRLGQSMSELVPRMCDKCKKAILKLREETSEQKDRLSSVTDIGYCRYCGAQIDYRDFYCAKCGKPF